MLISELAQQSGLTVATIKFYLREGLLPAGQVTSRTRAIYGQEHLDRLRLIRALLDVGGLPLATARSVIEVMEEGRVDRHDVVRRALYALGPDRGPEDDVHRLARKDVRRLLDGLGWLVGSDAPAIDQLAHALVVLRGSYPGAPADALLPYAAVAQGLARDEFARQPAGLDQAGLVAWAVTGTVVFESVLAAWRRLAHEDLANRDDS